MEIIAGHREECTFPDSHRHLPMQSQIALMFMAIMLAFGILASLLNSWITTRSFEENLDKKAGRYIQTVFNEYMEHQDDIQMDFFQNQLDQILEDEDIQSIGFYNSRNEVIIYSGLEITVPKKIYGSEYRNVSSLIRNNNVRYYKFSFSSLSTTEFNAYMKGQKVASIILSINDDLVFHTAQKAFFWTFLASMVAAICTMLLAVIVIRKFTGPFDRLSKAMGNAQLGQRGVRVTPGGASEVYQMATSFNAMIAVLERREENLLEQKRTLEKQINVREMTELELKNITSRLQSIFDNVTDGIVVVDEDCKIVSMNTSANRIYGYENGEIISKDLDLIMKTVFLKVAMSSLKGDGNKSTNYETMAICKSGKHIPTEIGISSMSFSGREHYLITIRDITERKKSDEELNDYRLHLESMVLEQTKDIAESRDAAMAGERAMSTFLANMSHELRTPMHGVLSYANIALKRIDSVPTEKTKEFLNEIKESGNNLLDIINDLLDLSKMKSGKMKYQYSRVCFSNVVKDVGRQMTALAEKDDKSLEISITGNEILFDMDAMRMTQVVRNLYANAIKFSKRGTEIKVDIDYTNNGKLVFSIFNYGVEIPKGEDELIFKNFEQSSNTKSNAGGTGLGLPICREIVEFGHNGEIRADKNVTGGARFIINIPFISRIDDAEINLKEAHHF